MGCAGRRRRGRAGLRNSLNALVSVLRRHCSLLLPAPSRPLQLQPPSCTPPCTPSCGPATPEAALCRRSSHAPPFRAGTPRAAACAASHRCSRANARCRRRRPCLCLARHVRRTTAEAGTPGRAFVGRGALNAVARGTPPHGVRCRACCATCGGASLTRGFPGAGGVRHEGRGPLHRAGGRPGGAFAWRRAGCDFTAPALTCPSPRPQEAFPDVQVEGNVAGVRPRCVARRRCWQVQQLAHAPAPPGRAPLRSPRRTGGPSSAAWTRGTSPQERSWWTACAACCLGSGLRAAHMGGEPERA